MDVTERAAGPVNEQPYGLAKLEATAQVLEFEPGFYSVEVSAPEIAVIRDKLIMPCIRLDPIAPSGAQRGRAHVAALSDGDFIMPRANAAYLRAEFGNASVLLTIYKVAGSQTVPEVRIRRIDGTEVEVVQPVPSIASLKLTLLAHVERSGDVTVPGGAWAGQPGGGGAIEGFAMTPEEILGPADIEYQAVLGTDWSTPWLAGGEYCGSRGLALPLLGVRLRLLGDVAHTHECTYWGSFTGVGEVGPIRAGETCAADGAQLEALRVVIVPRNGQLAETPPALPNSRQEQPSSKNLLGAAVQRFKKGAAGPPLQNAPSAKLQEPKTSTNAGPKTGPGKAT